MALRIEMTASTTTSITVRIMGAGNPITSAYYEKRAIIKSTAPAETRTVNGSTSYYISGDGYYSVETTFTGLQPGTRYSIGYGLTPIDSYERNEYFYFWTDEPIPDPAITSLSVSAVGQINASWNVANSAYLRPSNSIRIYLSGANNSIQYDQGYYSSGTRSWSKGLDGNNNALVPNANYTIWVYAYNSSGQSFGASRTFTFTRPRPSNFNWTNSKTSGGMYNLTSSEWNSFLDKINEFRSYKGLTQVSFNRNISSGTINSYIVPTASSFNGAINIINTLSPSSSPPSTVSTGTIINANHFNQIRNALNSVN